MHTVRIDLEGVSLTGSYEGFACFEHGPKALFVVVVDGRHDLPSVDPLVAHDWQLQDVFQRDECSFVKPQLEFPLVVAEDYRETF